MVRFYEMMYYAIYRRRLEGEADGFNYATRFYSGLVSLNVAVLLLLLNAVLQWQGVFLAKADLYFIFLAFMAGVVVDELMGRRAAKIKVTFEDCDWTSIATWLLVHLSVSLAVFTGAMWQLWVF